MAELSKEEMWTITFYARPGPVADDVRVANTLKFAKRQDLHCVWTEKTVSVEALRRELGELRRENAQLRAEVARLTGLLD